MLFKLLAWKKKNAFDNQKRNLNIFTHGLQEPPPPPPPGSCLNSQYWNRFLLFKYLSKIFSTLLVIYNKLKGVAELLQR